MSDLPDRNIDQLHASLEAIDESKRRLLEEGPLSQDEVDGALEEWDDILKERFKAVAK